jgi:hypothetical protein
MICTICGQVCKHVHLNRNVCDVVWVAWKDEDTGDTYCDHCAPGVVKKMLSAWMMGMMSEESHDLPPM